ncbi:hypothetical protein VCHA50O404_60084 [Vibrio chagasii]|nr:hypothetical protein VCHA50O402_50169 [Vibrio chagasii]CAH7368220.1 hypothetical protein VCHA50O404_60084 [Vibrio chagasii]CAK2514503.1 hypothetical protein VCRA2114E327_60083 [Vibrio crassostreae]CAK3651961.1 hypothetical protein VCRA2120O332_50160 [Vibrio crassostreae]
MTKRSAVEVRIPNSEKSQMQHGSMSNSDSEFWEVSDAAPFSE